MTGRSLRAEFARLVRQNTKTAVFISHSINEALEIGDRLIVLKLPANIATDILLSRGMPTEEREPVRAKIQDSLTA
jgi:NitT/TauT family transport system ATP-binding protein